MATLSALVETWAAASLDLSKWQDQSSGGGSYSLAGDGKLVLTGPGGGAADPAVYDAQYVGPTPYTLLGAHWLFGIVTPPTHIDSWVSATIYSVDSGSGVTNWGWTAFYINAYSGVRKLNIELSSTPFSGSVYQVPFDPVAHRYLGFTFGADGIRWWASVYGVSWNLLHYDPALITGPDAHCDLYAFDMFVQGVSADTMALGPVNTQPAPTGVNSVLTATVTYGGTWKEFPIIVVTGPITNPSIANTDTGETLTFTGLTVSPGQTLTINLAHGNKSAILSGGGGSALGYLSAASDLVSFHLAPSPEASGGANHITLTGTDVSGTTALQVKWYDRFVGI